MFKNHGIYFNNGVRLSAQIGLNIILGNYSVKGRRTATPSTAPEAMRRNYCRKYDIRTNIFSSNVEAMV
ncbi:hypothetical protein FACS189476_02680 [Spirochaetia bacterium]|nr:hypothetical protein FACS189476_02680 [Spirochaetia bacterium]